MLSAIVDAVATSKSADVMKSALEICRPRRSAYGREVTAVRRAPSDAVKRATMLVPAPVVPNDARGTEVKGSAEIRLIFELTGDFERSE